jgi:putative transposase
MTSPSVSYKHHRFPPAITAQMVWLYFRFPLSLRLVEEMLLERGIVVSYETVRRWAIKFGWDYARRLKRKRASRRDTGTGIVNLSEGRPKKGDFLKGEVRR